MEEMKPENSWFTRKNFYLLLLFCFLLPYFLVVGLSLSKVPPHIGKTIFLAALVGLSVALSCAYFLLMHFEKMMQQRLAHLVQAKIESMGDSLPTHEKEIARLQQELDSAIQGYEHQFNLLQSSSAKSKEQVEVLESELENLRQKARHLSLESEDIRRENERLLEEIAHLNQVGSQQLTHKEALLSEYQQTIQEQRAIIEKKQRYIAKLEEKVRDLMYEIRSLLQLEEGERIPIHDFPEQKEELAHYYLPSSDTLSQKVTTTYDLSLLLQKYIEVAEKFHGLGFKEGKSPRFFDMNRDSYAIDLRRLFDSFRDETTGILFVYSVVEGKLLFVNQHAKTVLGWSPEKLIKDFPQLVVSGWFEWKEQLSKITSQKEVQVPLTIAHKSGAQLPFQCFMGLVDSGPFMRHVVGILSPTVAIF